MKQCISVTHLQDIIIRGKVHPCECIQYKELNFDSGEWMDEGVTLAV